MSTYNVTPTTSPLVGRGAVGNIEGRFAVNHREAMDDGWSHDEEELPPALATQVQPDHSRSIISRNQSPDLPFSQSINPYRGCEHGCIYCFARPSHAYLDLSPGLDFETRLFYKPDAVALLENELSAKNYRCQPLALGSNTDPYQPIERQYQLMRGILTVLEKCNHPVAIVTKGSLIERDLDILERMAKRNLVSVGISITTLSNSLKRSMEPRAASPAARLRVIRALSEVGVPVSVMVAPVVPFLTDGEMESILESATQAGAKAAHYLLLRLPHEVKQLFRDWLTHHEPLKAKHILSLIGQLRAGKDNDPRFGSRHTGEGVYARLLAQRFEVACQRLGLKRPAAITLDVHRFVPPARVANLATSSPVEQLTLFGE